MIFMMIWWSYQLRMFLCHGCWENPALINERSIMAPALQNHTESLVVFWDLWYFHLACLKSLNQIKRQLCLPSRLVKVFVCPPSFSFFIFFLSASEILQNHRFSLIESGGHHSYNWQDPTQASSSSFYMGRVQTHNRIHTQVRKHKYPRIEFNR